MSTNEPIFTTSYVTEDQTTARTEKETIKENRVSTRAETESRLYAGTNLTVSGLLKPVEIADAGTEKTLEVVEVDSLRYGVRKPRRLKLKAKIL